MRIFLFIFLAILNVNSYATLTVGKVPVTKTGGSNPAIQDSNEYAVVNNIGIGSANPGQALDVTGTIRASGTISASNLSGTNTGDQTITLTGDITGSGTGSIPTTAKNTGTAGTYRSTTFDAQGRETSGTNPTTFSGYGISDSSTNLRAALTDSTGTGSIVFSASPNITGLVGINNASPGVQLDVTGTIRSLTLDVNGTTTITGIVTMNNLTASQPVIINSNNQLSTGTYSGTTTKLVTSTGTLTNGNFASWDSNGNAVASGTANNAAGIVSLFSTCSGTQYLGADGACHNSGGSASAAGGTNAVQYNSGSSTFAGAENIFSFNGTNVGIGTTNGIGLFDISGTLNRITFMPSGNIGIGTTANQASLSVMQGNIGIGTWAPLGPFQVGTGNSSLWVNSSGNVSIGTKTSTSNLLTIGNTGATTFSNTGNLNANSIISSGGVSTSNSGSAIGGSGSGSSFFTIFNGGANAASIAQIKSSSTNGTTDSIKFLVGNNGGTEAMRVQDASGIPYVGIGTASPGATLDVEGTLNPIVLNGLNRNNVGIGSFTPGATLDINGTIRIVGGGDFITQQVTAPTVANNDCGTTVQGSIAANSSDLSGTVAVGTLNVTSCAVTFNGTFNAAPNCICQDDSNVLAVRCTATTTKLTITSLASMSSDNVTWWCPTNK